MTEDLIHKIENSMNPIPSINLRGIPAKDSQIIAAQHQLNVKFHDDYVTFIKIFGGAFAGLPIYAFENNEMMSNQTVVDLTKMFREDYDDKRSEILNKSYVISFDGGGNPILIDSYGKVMIFYHDNDQYKIFATSFSEFVEKAIDNEYQDEW